MNNRVVVAVTGIVRLVFLIAAISVFCIGSSIVKAQDQIEGITLAPGFSVKKIYDVSASQGSWVSICTDPEGRLIVSDQYGLLYRVTVDPETGDVQTEPINVQTGRAHGLLHAFGSLYVMSHNGEGQPSGLYRVRDTDSDDKYDSVELLIKMEGSGEHGPHAIVLSPDGKSLFLCGGNHTRVPGYETSRVPEVWGEDQVLPRLWDASGHAVNIMAPGGWVVSCDPEGKNVELFSIGYRNQYDIAFNEAGDLFTFDADMEWDIGLPWYRPTRVCHVTSGSEFGWRSGTGKWSPAWPDNLPAVLDIGPASPTGVTFGTGAKFPKRYRDALYVADWSYGVIHMLHLSPSGATYSAERETLLSGPGMAVTDMTVNPVDGSLYFMIGGRRSRSALYRVWWSGAEVPATENAENVARVPPNELHELRRKLESWHQLELEDSSWLNENAQVLLQAVAHEDRFIRFAARTVVERLNPEWWMEAALLHVADKELSMTARLEIALAVVRCGADADRVAVANSLMAMDFSGLPNDQKISWLRITGLVMARSKSLPDGIREAICDKLDPVYPTGNSSIDSEICRDLVAAGSTKVIAPTIALMKSGPTQELQIHYFYCLGNATAGWTEDTRREYLQWYLGTGSLRGGNSFAKFLANIRDVAISNIPENQRSALDELIARAPESRAPAPVAPDQKREFVRKWTKAELMDISEEELAMGNPDRGHQMMIVGQCYACHRVGDVGGNVGPDLTAAGRRFSMADLVETIVDPDKSISDQYMATIFQLEDGTMVTGRIANLNQKHYMIQTNMLDPGNFTHIDVTSIVGQRPSTVSMMPAGLLDTMKREEIIDLLSFMRATGNAAATERDGENQ